MRFKEWFIRNKLNKDPVRLPSIWHTARQELERMSVAQKESLLNEWREWNRDSVDQVTRTKSHIDYDSPVIFNGIEVPGDLRKMDEVQYYLNLPPSERAKILRKWKESKSLPKEEIVPDLDRFQDIQSTQLHLFDGTKISTLLRALKKVSNAR